MNDQHTFRRELPQGYECPPVEEAAGIHAELQRELPEGHLLFGVPVETFAVSTGNDDVLFQHVKQPERFTIVHLTWIGKTEINAQHPTVEFDGTFEKFVIHMEEFWSWFEKTFDK